MKEKEYLIRPAGIVSPAPYAIYEIIGENRAKQIFWGTAPECYKELNRIRANA